MMRLKAIAIALALHLPATYAADRLRGSSSQQEAVVTASTVEEAPSHEIDVQSAGIDRSLASIHESELSFLNDEQVEALGEYITRYSKDGNTDIPETCPFDYEGDVDPYHPDSYTTLSENGRSLMGEMDMEQEIAHAHAHTHYIESNCNSMLNMTTCMNWTQWVDINNITMSSEVKIPCGECVTLDAGPGQDMAGHVLEFEQGLNIVGKLVIPSGADIQLITKYVFVQGLLEMPPPPQGTTISSEDVGPKVKITLYGTDDIFFTADNATDNTHVEGEAVSAKAFVVAGGRVDVRALDPSCPGWVKLQSVTYGEPLPNLALGKPATQSSTYNNINGVASKAVDGNYNSFTHTDCWKGINQWWRVDLKDVYTIATITVGNRLDCCGGRFHDATFYFYDENDVEVYVMPTSGGIGKKKSFSVDFVSAQYIKVVLGDKDCLQIGEFEAWGWKE